MNHLIDMLQKSAEADKSKALLTLELLSNHPAGIGDHSTDDFYNYQMNFKQFKKKCMKHLLQNIWIMVYKIFH